MYRTLKPPRNHDFIPNNGEEMYWNIRNRRLGFLRALFIDNESFYSSCDPEKENLCLYAYPNKKWQVTPPFEQLPQRLPEPVLGINFARDGMQRKDWLSHVAARCDVWLLSLVSFFGSWLTRDERTRLFDRLNELPNLYEEVENRHPWISETSPEK